MADKHRASILLVADEVLVRNYLNAALTQEGYRVIAAANSSEALDLAHSYPGGLHLLLSCLSAADGMDLARRFLDQRPGRRALLASPSLLDALKESAGADLVAGRPAPRAVVEALGRALSDPHLGACIVIQSS